MGRRAVAVVTLLLSALLLHLTLPHHTSASGPAAAVEQTAERWDFPADISVESDQPHVGTTAHHAVRADTVGRPARSRQYSVASADAPGQGTTAVPYEPPAGPAAEHTARQRRLAGLGQAPTPAELQTFRC
ncbi:hypothetical protein [Streptomyces sp.]|uniref:hypothetical protein n=1 Tax=Streptomyces sp. TaxID=1931 RepID=UPI002F42B275